MKKIASHNSATGEQGMSFWASLLYKCQTKTLEEQYMAGCRLFHFRVRYCNGVWKCVNGRWESKDSFKAILVYINALQVCNDKVSIVIEHDGVIPAGEDTAFVEEMNLYQKLYCPLASLEGVAYWDGFQIALSGLKDNYIEDYTDRPLPWLRRLFVRKRPFVDSCFTITDFL